MCSLLTEDTGDIYLPFITMDALYGVSQVFLPESDDGVSGALSAGGSDGFPFGGSVQTQLYVCVQSAYTHIYTQKHIRMYIHMYIQMYNHSKHSLLHRLAQMDSFHLTAHTTAGLTSSFQVAPQLAFAIWWLHFGMMWTSEEAMEESHMKPTSQAISLIR